MFKYLFFSILFISDVLFNIKQNIFYFVDYIENIFHRKIVNKVPEKYFNQYYHENDYQGK